MTRGGKGRKYIVLVGVNSSRKRDEMRERMHG